MKREAQTLLIFGLILVIGDISASFFCWTGTPFDASPNPRFGFWYLEIWRLAYWALFFSLACLVWITIQRHPFAKRLRWPVWIGLALIIELGTNMWYQSRLPFGLSFAMYATDLGLYMRQHLIWWTTFSLMGFGGWAAQRHWRHRLSS